MNSPTRSAMTCAAAALGVLALAGCGDSADKGKKAAFENSEVLQGSISDDMIPYDTLRSEPPPAKIAVDDDGEGRTASGTASREPSAEASPPTGPADTGPSEPPPLPPAE